MLNIKPDFSQVMALVDEEESFSYAMQMAMSGVVAMALQTTFELGIFDIIAKAGKGVKLSANDIADQLSTNNPEASKMLDSVLGLLASHSLLHCSSSTDLEEGNVPSKPKRLYGLTGASKFFASDADGVSLRPIVTLAQHKAYLESWVFSARAYMYYHYAHRPRLKDTILEGGRAFERTHGMHMYEYLGTDSEFNQIFNTALQQHSSIVMKRVLECYKGFENLKTIVDVAGGVGRSLSFIVSKYPHIRAINFDLPHVIQQAPPYPGVEHVTGDMFESVPKGDAIFLKWILHDWSNEKCLKLLKNCYEAITEEGKVIALELVFSDMPETTASAKCNFEFDVFMMTQAGGRERNEQELMELAKAAGFKDVQYQCFVCNFWVIEFFK